MILPVAVILNRRFAPLCVLSFTLLPIGHFLSFRTGRAGSTRRHDHRHGAAFHPGSLFYSTVILKLDRKLIEQIATKLRVGYGPSPEQYGQFDLIPAVKELRCLAALGLKIGFPDLGLNAYFLEPGDMLMLLGLSFLTTLFVPELSVVHQPTHRRSSIRRHFNQVESPFTRHIERLTGGDDTDLPTFVVN